MARRVGEGNLNHPKEPQYCQELARTLGNLGVLAGSAKKVDEAAKWYRQSIAVLEASPYRHDLLTQMGLQISFQEVEEGRANVLGVWEGAGDGPTLMFNGHLDTAPPVKDFAAEGFALVGGRLDYIDHRPVAAMVYRHGLHPINLFVWADPSATAGQPGATSRQGYNIRHWVEKDMTFWLISDLEADQLDRLERLLRQPE